MDVTTGVARSINMIRLRESGLQQVMMSTNKSDLRKTSGQPVLLTECLRDRDLSFLDQSHCIGVTAHLIGDCLL